jgi:hypothetical protein
MGGMKNNNKNNKNPQCGFSYNKNSKIPRSGISHNSKVCSFHSQTSHSILVISSMKRSQNMKGQVFLAGAILFLVMFVVIGSGLVITGSYHESFSSDRMENVVNELRFVAMTNSTNNLGQISEYLVSDVSGLKVLTMTSRYESGKYMLDLYNFVGERLIIKIDGTDVSIENKGHAYFETGNKIINIEYSLEGVVADSIVLYDGIRYFDIVLKDKDMIRKRFVFRNQGN